MRSSYFPSQLTVGFLLVDLSSEKAGSYPGEPYHLPNLSLGNHLTRFQYLRTPQAP